MALFLIRLAVLFGVVFGVAYGITKSLKSVRQRKLLQEVRKANEQMQAVRVAYEAGEIERDEYDELTHSIYESARQKGVPFEIEAEEEEEEEEEEAEHTK